MRAPVFIVAMLALSCGTAPPTPDPPPGPAPVPPIADVFEGAVINCELPEVESEAVALGPMVHACLVDVGVAACLVSLTDGYHVDAVACEVRRQGMVANRRVLAERPGTDDVTVDEAARAWIRQKGLGYR